MSAVELADGLVWMTVVDVASWSERLLVTGCAGLGTDNGGLLSPSTANSNRKLSEGKHLMRESRLKLTSCRVRDTHWKAIINECGRRSIRVFHDAEVDKPVESPQGFRLVKDDVEHLVDCPSRLATRLWMEAKATAPEDGSVACGVPS